MAGEDVPVSVVLAANAVAGSRVSIRLRHKNTAVNRFFIDVVLLKLCYCAAHKSYGKGGVTEETPPEIPDYAVKKIISYLPSVPQQEM